MRDRLRDVDRALKIADKRGQIRLFKSEFRQLSEIRHPNIVRSYDYGLSDRGMPYYTQELVRGVQLSDFEERWDSEVLALIAMQILDALATLHARGWVHRDIKPDNLLMVGSGGGVLVRLIDLGLLSPVGEAAAAAGTLPYIAPEVARGVAADGRADLHSLGVVLYEALLPDDAPDTLEEVSRRLTERPPSPSRLNPAIPSGLSDFIMRLLEPEPAARFADADEASEALSRIPGLHIGRGPQLAVAERVLRGGAISHRDKDLGAACGAGPSDGPRHRGGVLRGERRRRRGQDAVHARGRHGSSISRASRSCACAPTSTGHAGPGLVEAAAPAPDSRLVPDTGPVPSGPTP